MDIRDFKSGSYRKGFNFSWFLPEKINHSFTWNDEAIDSLLEEASRKTGELNSISHFVPDTDMFIKMHIYKEAVISSRIEGTQTNIDEALRDKKNIAAEQRDDWQEVNNYVCAMNSALQEIESIPLSGRLIKSTNKILLSNV